MPEEDPIGVLVVDDDDLVRPMLAAALPRLGFALWLAASGAEAVAVYGRERAAIHVVLLDVHMPGLDGTQTLAALRQLEPGVRAVFMSGNTGPYSVEELLGLGAADVLVKPFGDLGRLAGALRAAAGR